MWYFNGKGNTLVWKITVSSLVSLNTYILKSLKLAFAPYLQHLCSLKEQIFKRACLRKRQNFFPPENFFFYKDLKLIELKKIIYNIFYRSWKKLTTRPVQPAQSPNFDQTIILLYLGSVTSICYGEKTINKPIASTTNFVPHVQSADKLLWSKPIVFCMTSPEVR